jgi:hypothetical protein
MSILGKLFPETLFPRKLSAEGEQRLRLAQARAEEALIRAHVDNALHFVETLSSELTFERALDVYIREMNVPDPLASIIATRALVQLGDALTPAHAGAADESGEVPMPRLRQSLTPFSVRANALLRRRLRAVGDCCFGAGRCGNSGNFLIDNLLDAIEAQIARIQLARDDK